uniref:Carboxylesterase type B domain-containing protein n=1 Tax=Strigamia maritima TaxID=126957 RepID=T1J2W1_STRMM
MIPLCIIIILLLSPALSTGQPLQDHDQPTATTTTGILHGRRASTSSGLVDQFLGVPYAKPPVNNLRFKPPLSYRSRKHVETSTYAPSCMQPPHLEAAMYPQINGNESEFANSEDCLYLNIYLPTPTMTKTQKKDKLAILFWVPGEGYNYASSRQFDGSMLASFGQVMVVTINYRVSAFGFLTTGSKDEPGNVGIWDQIAALRWVKENGRAFGGDVEKVTLVGRFTGAMSITALIASPMAMHDGIPLFHRAVIQSGVADGGNWIFDRNPIEGMWKLARKVGCNESEIVSEVMKCLRNVDAVTLNEASASIHSWRLVLDDDVVPMEPMKSIKAGKHVPVPVVLGYTNDEGSLCVMTQKLIKSRFFPELVDDQLDREEFAVLAKGFFNEYLSADENVDQVARDAVEVYEKASGSWRDRYVKMCGDVYVKHKVKAFASQMSVHGSRVFMYEFLHRPEESIHPEFLRGAHGDDVLFMFGLARESRSSTEAEKRLSVQMMTAWTSFVKFGNPNPMLDSDDEWPAYSIFEKQYWQFSTFNGDKVKNIKEDNNVDSFLSSVTRKESEKRTNNSIQH